MMHPKIAYIATVIATCSTSKVLTLLYDNFVVDRDRERYNYSDVVEL